jgi:hypothetical protein
MRLAIRMAEDGTLSDLDLDAPEGTLAVLQGAVEGHIERVQMGNVDMWVNEEGLYTLADRHNPYASAAMQIVYRGVGYINGPVAFTGGVDAEGNTLGLTAEHENALRVVLKALVEVGQ